MANAIDEAEGLAGIAVMIAVLAIVVWLLSTLVSLFGGQNNTPSGAGPTNPFAKLSNLTNNIQNAETAAKTSLAGNPSDPGYDFLYGSNAWSWAAFSKWFSGKWQETVTPDQNAGQGNWDWNPSADSSSYTPGTDQQLDSELQPF